MTKKTEKTEKDNSIPLLKKKIDKPKKNNLAEKKRIRQCRGGYKIVDFNMRVDIIYDSLVHNIQPIEISRIRDIKYNTVRHVL